MAAKVVSVDIGYGDVKIFDGKNQYKMPTAIAPYSFSAFMGSINHDKNSPYNKENIYTLDGKDYLIGERALQDVYCKTTRSDNFVLKYTPLFIYKTIELIGYIPDSVALGIPLVKYIASDSESFKEKYRERVSKFIINKQIISIDNIEIYAQGHGIYIDSLMKDENKDLGDKSVLVVDIGFNTIDILWVINGTPTRKNSTTLVNKGVVAIIKDLQEYIKNNHDIDLSEQVAKDILIEKKIEIYGHKIDLTGIIQDLIEDYASWLVEEIEGRMKDTMQRVSKVIIAGGGAYYVKNFIPDKYNFIYIPEIPEFSNARGYYALSLWNNQNADGE